jgi:hypothetical protein
VHQRAFFWYPIYWEATNTHKLKLEIIYSSTCLATQLAWKCPPPWKPCHQFLEDFAMCLQLAGQLQQWLHRNSVYMFDVGALLIAHTKAECAQDKSVVIRLVNNRPLGYISGIQAASGCAIRGQFPQSDHLQNKIQPSSLGFCPRLSTAWKLHYYCRCPKPLV